MSDNSPPETALVWDVEPADWPTGELLGDEPTKLVPQFERGDLTETEENIWDSLLDMGGIGDEVLCYGGLVGERFAPGAEVDVFDVHAALVEGIKEEDSVLGELVEVLNEDA